eukprot:Amastigsp_a339951_77.p3 type:complete len:278 gc:universal Amastigsp_a339951_77:2777-1944(-)
MSGFDKDVFAQFLRKSIKLYKRTLAFLEEDACGSRSTSASVSGSGSVSEKRSRHKKSKSKEKPVRMRRVTKAEKQGKKAGPWTSEENRALIDGVRKYGSNYDKLCECVSSRTRMQIYHHIDFLKKKRLLPQTHQNLVPPGFDLDEHDDDHDHDEETSSSGSRRGLQLASPPKTLPPPIPKPPSMAAGPIPLMTMVDQPLGVHHDDGDDCDDSQESRARKKKHKKHNRKRHSSSSSDDDDDDGDDVSSMAARKRKRGRDRVDDNDDDTDDSRAHKKRK